MRDRPTFRPGDRAAVRSAPAGPPGVDLVVVASPVDSAIGLALRLDETPRVLGRVADAHGDDDWMSREHATLRRVDGVILLRDGSLVDGVARPSANGTFVIGPDAREEAQVHGEVGLLPGQLVRTGRTLWTALENAAPTPPGSLLIGVSDALGRVRDEVKLVVAEVALRMERRKRVTQSLLVTGQRGTGKQVVAREAHRRLCELRGDAALPFVDLPAPALGDGTSAADVFGVVDRYATDVKGRPGCFERAHGGVLLIDEVADLPLTEQAKLLNVLEERQVTRLGARTPVAFDCLVIAATNRDLEALVREGSFRADLLDRLRRFHVHLSPLSERREDVLPLASSLLRRNAFSGALAVEVAVELWRRPWPGGVRELDAFMERLAALARSAGRDQIDKAILDRALQATRATHPGGLRQPRSTAAAATPVPGAPGGSDMPSREELLRCLVASDWNKTEVGRRFGKHPRQITRWMAYLDIVRPS